MRTCRRPMSPRRAARRAPRAPALRRTAPARDRSTVRRRPPPREAGRSTDTRGSRLGTPGRTAARDPAGGSPAPAQRARCTDPDRARQRAAPAPGARWRARPLADPDGTAPRQDHPAPLAQRCLGDTGARQRGDLLQPHPPEAVRPGAAPRRRDASPPGDRPRSEPVPSRGARRRARPATARAPPRTCARPVRAHRAPAAAYPASTSRSNRSASTSTCSGTSRYPCGVVSIWAGAMSRRNRMMHPGTICDHEAGGSSPHSAAARDAADNGAPRRTVSAAITARSRGASGIRPSSSVSAPRTRTSMAPLCARLRHPSRRLISGRYTPDGRRYPADTRESLTDRAATALHGSNERT